MIMGDPRKKRKQYEKPRKAFQKERIEKEREMKKVYGLKNKKELYRAETIVRTKRGTARKLLALSLENRLRREKELLDSLKKVGILTGSPTLDDVLVLTPEALLERRLQTLVWRKGMANTLKQSRQFIVHGHIAVNGKKIDRPSYIVEADEESKISWYGDEVMFEQKKHAAKKGPKAAEKENELKKQFEEAKPTEAKADANAEAKE
ncbi:30S ribosomal protein S4 [uncultured archaeon]|nr:30S ribosomal protein S4 [uncultured archaeon]